MVTCLGQDGHDLVGPDASQGSDGIQDLHLQLSGLYRRRSSQIVVQATGGFRVGNRARSDRVRARRVFSVVNRRVRAIFISTRRSRATCRPRGPTLPLGGSTGSLIQLANGMTSDRFTINLPGPDQLLTLRPSSCPTSFPRPIPCRRSRLPATSSDTFQVTDDGQDGTGQPYEQGFVHLVVTAPSGVDFNAATFGQVLWQLSDPVGISWDSTSDTFGPQPHLRDFAGEHDEHRRPLLPPRARRGSQPAARPRPPCCCRCRYPTTTTSMRRRSWERTGI